MTEKLHIEPRDAGERERLLAALEAEPARVLTIRCARGCKLARVASGTAGIVFAAEPWEVPRRRAMHVVQDGKPLGRREAVRAGYSDNPVEVHATLALLDSGAEPVDLLVRCQHGDALLERAQIIEWARETGAKPTVRTSMPRKTYTSPARLGRQETVSTFTRTITGDSMSVEEMRRWLDDAGASMS